MNSLSANGPRSIAPGLGGRWWRRSIRWQLITGVAVVQTLLIMVFVVGLVQRQKAFLQGKSRQRIEFQTRLLAASSQHAVLTSDLAALENMIANLADDSTVKRAMITDPQGHVLAHSEKSRAGLFLNDPLSQKVLQGPGEASIVSESDHSMAAATPIIVNSHVVGWAWITRDTTDDQRYLEYVTLGGLSYTLLAAFAGAVVAVLLAGAILRPLQLLLAGAARVAGDRLDEPIPITTENEVGTVAQAFNLAMHRLASQREALLDEVARRTRAQQEADESNRAKDHFLAVLSHELRTPLTPVLTLAQMLERDTSLSAETHDDIVTIRRNVEVEARLIDDLLDLTRISRGKIDLRFVSVDIHRTLRDVIGMCREEGEGKSITLETHFGAQQTTVQADPTRLQQVFWNVLKNSIKFTSPHGRIIVRTSTQPHVPFANEAALLVSDDVVVEIEDDGVGIEPEKLPHVFNAFEQGGKEVTRVFGGLGLGLTIGRALIDLHGGEITAHSEGKDQGTVLRIRLPVGVSVSTLQRPEKGPATGDSVKRHILLVEDHPDTLLATSRLLRQCGYEVETADTVAGAIELARREHFDLIVSDIGLPDGTGNELIRRLVSEAPLQGAHVKGIAISGFGQKEDIRRSREAGFLDHLIKPFDPQELIDAVDDALAQNDPAPANANISA